MPTASDSHCDSAPSAPLCTHEVLRHESVGSFCPVIGTMTKTGPKTDPSIHRIPQGLSRLFRATDPSRALPVFLDKGGNATPGFPTTGHSSIDVFRDELWENTGKGHFLLPHPKQPRCGTETQLGSLPGKICREILQGHPRPRDRRFLSAR